MSEGLRTFLPQAISEMWMRPSMPGASSTKAPKSASRVTVPETLSPRWKRSGTVSQGWGWSCLRPMAMRRFSGLALSILRILASMVSPTERMSAGLATRCQAMSEMWRRASAPPRSTKAPKSVRERTVPRTVWPSASSEKRASEVARGFFFEDGAAVDDGVGAGGFGVAEIELGDADADLLADELFHLGGVAGSGAGGGHEGAHADIDGEAALDDAGDGAEDGAFGFKGFFEGAVVLGRGDALAGELVVAVEVAAFDGDAEFVAGFDGLFGGAEGGEGQDAFGLVADVEEDGIGGDGDYGGVDLFGAAGAVDCGGAGGVVFAEEGGEVF